MIIQQKVVMLMDLEHMMVKFTTEQEERQKKCKNPLQLLHTDQKDMIVQKIMEVNRTENQKNFFLIDELNIMYQIHII